MSWKRKLRAPTAFVGCVALACTKPAPVGDVAQPAATPHASAAVAVDASAPEVDSAIAPPPARGTWDDDPPKDAADRPSTLPPLDPATAYDVGPDTVLIFRRTECFGSCPAYSVGVRGDGSVHFYGESSTQTVGYASADIGRAGVAALLAFLRRKSFLSLHTHYVAMATDHAKAVIVLRRGRGLKYVERDESNTSEPALDSIEKEIDRATGTARWIGPPVSAGRPAFHPPAKIPPADFARMAGPRLHAIERTCALGRRLTLKVELGIDEFGGAVFHGGGYPTAAAASFACLEKHLPSLVFPLAGVWQPSSLPVSLAP